MGRSGESTTAMGCPPPGTAQPGIGLGRAAAAEVSWGRAVGGLDGHAMTGALRRLTRDPDCLLRGRREGILGLWEVDPRGVPHCFSRKETKRGVPLPAPLRGRRKGSGFPRRRVRKGLRARTVGRVTAFSAELLRGRLPYLPLVSLLGTYRLSSTLKGSPPGLPPRGYATARALNPKPLLGSVWGGGV